MVRLNSELVLTCNLTLTMSWKKEPCFPYISQKISKTDLRHGHHGDSPYEGRPLVVLQQYTSHKDKLGWQSQALHCWKSLKLGHFLDLLDCDSVH